MKKTVLLVALLLLVSGCSFGTKSLSEFSLDQHNSIFTREGGNNKMVTSGMIETKRGELFGTTIVDFFFIDQEQQEEVSLQCNVQIIKEQEKRKYKRLQCSSKKTISDMFLSGIIMNQEITHYDRKEVPLPYYFIEQFIESKKRKSDQHLTGTEIKEAITYQFTGTEKTRRISSSDNKRTMSGFFSHNPSKEKFILKRKNSLDTITRLSIQGELKKNIWKGKIIVSPPAGDRFRLDDKIEIDRSLKPS